MKHSLFLISMLLGLALTGCVPGPKSSSGFSLPDGSKQQGEAVFVELECHNCHTVNGVKLPEPETEREATIALGGKVARIKTYGELVTSIINPSHKLAGGFSTEAEAEIGKSLMKNYNEAMTVQQLIDLVAFLQAHYELKEYEISDYPMYY